VEAGYEDRLLISQDIWIKQCLRHYGGWGYDHIIRSIVPMLQRAGLSDFQVRKLLIDNPVKALSIQDTGVRSAS
jgi:phosphotriesterase-related protein